MSHFETRGLECIFLKMNFLKNTNSKIFILAKNGARDLLLVSFCRELYRVSPRALYSKTDKMGPFQMDAHIYYIQGYKL